MIAIKSEDKRKVKPRFIALRKKKLEVKVEL